MNKIRKLILCRGIQGSGKTTWAKKWVKNDSSHRVRFNNDDIRNMLGTYWVPDREGLVNELKTAFLKAAMVRGYDIIIDNMNLNSKEIAFYTDFISCTYCDFQYVIEFKDFFIPLQECVKRDSLRENPIGEKVITETYHKYKTIVGNETVHI